MAKIAVVVTDRQAEAFRMSIGLTVLEDGVDIFITSPLNEDETTETQLEAIRDLNLKVYATIPNSGYEYVSPETMADKLLEYDQVLPY
jgi:hypothetical protein